MSNIQFDYSTLSTSLSRSELGSIIGRHIVESSYDINEETSSERSSASSEIFVQPVPPDKCRFVYLTFGLLGITTLLPWNFFITANDYWMYKFRDVGNASCPDYANKTELQAAFTSYLTISNNVPFVIFLFLCTIFNNKFSKIFFVALSLIAVFILFSAVTAFVKINTDSWQTGFLALTLFMVAVVGITSAVLQVGFAGIASLFPPRYIHAMVLGQAFAGILASIVQILSLVGHCNSTKSALIYFFFADVSVIITLISYMGIQKSVFFKYHVCSLQGTTLLKEVSEPEVKTKVSVLYVTKQIWPYALCVMLVIWITISIFPSLAVLAVPSSGESIFNGKLFLPVTCFLLFNVADFCGRIVGGWLPFPPSHRATLVLLCSVRVIFIPLFMLCNVQPRYSLPVMFLSDIYYISFITLLGLTNGYFMAAAMVVGVKSVNPLLQETAGIVMSVFLGIGLTLGALFSYAFINLV